MLLLPPCCQLLAGASARELGSVCAGTAAQLCQVQPLTRSEGYAFVYMAYLVQVTFAAYYFDIGLISPCGENLAVLAWLYDRQSVLEPLIDRVIKSKERGLHAES